MKAAESEIKVLNTISLHSGVSRKELAKITGLSQATITNITKQLIQRAYILEGERIGTGLGRKEIMLYTNADKFYFVGIDIGGYRLRLSFSDNRLNILHSAEYLMSDIQADMEKESAVAELLHGFLADIGRPAAAVSAIGIGATGIVDSGKQVILNIPNAEHWDRVPIVEELRNQFDCPVFLEEGGRTMALAEKYIGKAKAETDFIVVHSAFGVVAGIVSNGDILRGADNAGGLLGHITADPNGLRCTCGNYGCLENIVTYPMLQRQFEEKGGSHATILEAYRQNDKIAFDVCINAGQALGIALSNVVNLFNPLSIYLGGPMFDDFPLIFEETKRTVTLRANRFATLSLKLERSSFNHEQGIYGALLLAKTNILFV